jgi:hypothetical protein
MAAWTIGHDEPFDEPEPCEACEDEECLGCDGPDDSDREQDQQEAAERWHAPFGSTGGSW